jgi:predicted DNA-binding transcriptional regulator YafY
VLDKETSRLSRLIAILTQLQSKRLLTATEVAQKFNISVRTVYRDIRALQQSGVPIVTEDGKGYSLAEGYRLPPVMFTESEANALITAEKIVLVNKDNSLIKNYGEAITKIKTVLRNNAKDKAELLSQRIVFWRNPAHNSATSSFLSSVQIALTDFILIKIEYCSPGNGETTTRVIEPFALINNVGESWLLIAWCRLRKDFRTFRFDRLKKLEILDDKFTPHKISLKEYFERYEKYFKHP